MSVAAVVNAMVSRVQAIKSAWTAVDVYAVMATAPRIVHHHQTQKVKKSGPYAALRKSHGIRKSDRDRLHHRAAVDEGVRWIDLGLSVFLVEVFMGLKYIHYDFDSLFIWAGLWVTISDSIRSFADVFLCVWRLATQRFALGRAGMDGQDEI